MPRPRQRLLNLLVLQFALADKNSQKCPPGRLPLTNVVRAMPAKAIWLPQETAQKRLSR
jgi:hypothetical protein